jgi:hypothetical protein
MSRVVAHVHRLGQLVASPGDMWLLVRMLGWSLVLPLLKRTVPLPGLVLMLHSGASVTARDPAREEAVADISEWVFRSRPRKTRDNCLERALVTYRYLCRAGAEPTIVVGMAKRDQLGRAQLAGHVWVTVDGRPVHDDPQRMEGFAALAAFAADGRMLSTEATIQSVERLEGRPKTAKRPPAAPPR